MSRALLDAPAAVPVPAAASEAALPAGTVLRFSPERVAEVYLEASAAWIQAAAAHAEPGRAAVLGCGYCADIPLDALARRFARVELVDVDDGAVDAVRRRVAADPALAATARVHHADLAGLVEELAEAARAVVDAAHDPMRALSELAALLDEARPAFWSPPGGEALDLVVCSSVLTQLQASVRAPVEAAFLARYRRFAFALGTHERWRRATWRFARALESAFLEHVERMLAPGGVVYLSDTVHAYWVRQTGPDTWETPGAWITLRSGTLRDYLQPWHTVLAEGTWPWVLRRAEGPYWGRLYGCQALVYRVGAP